MENNTVIFFDFYTEETRKRFSRSCSIPMHETTWILFNQLFLNLQRLASKEAFQANKITRCKGIRMIRKTRTAADQSLRFRNKETKGKNNQVVEQIADDRIAHVLCKRQLRDPLLEFLQLLRNILLQRNKQSAYSKMTWM